MNVGAEVEEPMKVEENKVVSIHYTLTLESGEIVDSTEGADPLDYIAGVGNIIPGLDSALMGCEVGDSKKVTVPASEAYGEVDENLIQALPRDMFTGVEKIEVGMEFQAQNESGDAQYVVVTNVTEEEITVDGNHEFAGKTLNFDVTIDAIRNAAEDELD